MNHGLRPTRLQPLPSNRPSIGSAVVPQPQVDCARVGTKKLIIIIYNHYILQLYSLQALGIKIPSFTCPLLGTHFGKTSIDNFI